MPSLVRLLLSLFFVVDVPDIHVHLYFYHFLALHGRLTDSLRGASFDIGMIRGGGVNKSDCGQMM